MSAAPGATATATAPRAWRWLRALVLPGILLVAVALVLVGVLGHLTGVRLVPVLSGSMTPTASVGSLVVTTPVHPQDVAEGDVVAFAPPPPYTTPGDRPVLHRVVQVGRDVEGAVTMLTKGDANPVRDPWTVDLARGGDLARARVVVPSVGYLAAGGALATAAVLAGVLLVWGARELLRRRASRCRCPAGEC